MSLCCAAEPAALVQIGGLLPDEVMSLVASEVMLCLNVELSVIHTNTYRNPKGVPFPGVSINYFLEP
jgi:hypothetical protein